MKRITALAAFWLACSATAPVLAQTPLYTPYYKSTRLQNQLALDPHPSGAMPANPRSGWMSYDSTLNAPVYYNGYTWSQIGTVTTPGGALNALQFNNQGAFGGLTLTPGQLLVGQTGSPSGITLSGDATMDALGHLTLSSVNGSIGTYSCATITARPDGRITAASAGTCGTPPGGSIGEVQVNNGAGFAGLTAAQLTGLIAPASSTTSGAVPAPGVSTGSKFLADTMQWLTPSGAGIGTVTSVGISLPLTLFNAPPPPVTSSGTLSQTLAAQPPDQFFASPIGVTGVPTWRPIDARDIPAINLATGVFGNLAVSNLNNGLNASINTYWRGDQSWAPIPPGNPGTVTSVALSLPASLFSVSGSPVISSGALTGTLINVPANLMFAGPGTGADATPTWRVLLAADLPPIDLSGSMVTGNLGINHLCSGTNAGVDTYLRGDCSWQTLPSSTGATPGGAANSLQYNAGGGALGGLGLGTNGQLLIGQTGGLPTFNTVSGDATLAANGAVAVGSLGGKVVTLGGALTTGGALTVANAASANNVAYVSGAGALGNEALTALIDATLGNARGSVLERGVSGWTALVPGGLGTVLTSGGPGADPSYQAAAGGGATPGGATFAMQYNFGGGVLGGIAPLTDGQLLVGSTGAAPIGRTISGDATLSVGGALTVTSINGRTATLGGTLITAGGVNVASLTTPNNVAYVSGAGGLGNETLTALIDAAIGNTRGGMLTRTATGWTVATGALGQIPISAGPGADTVFADPVVSQATASLLNATVVGPAGATLATSALQTSGNASLTTIATNSSLAATSALQTSGNTSLTTIATNSGLAATSALQGTANTALNSILTALQGSTPTGTNTIGAVTGPGAVALATSALQTTGNGYLSTLATASDLASTSALQITGNTTLSSILTAVQAAVPPGTNTIGAVTLPGGASLATLAQQVSEAATLTNILTAVQSAVPPGANAIGKTSVGPQTLIPADVGSVSSGGVAVTALAAGHCAAGCVIMVPSGATADLCVNAFTTAAGTTTGAQAGLFCVPKGGTFQIPPTANAISVVSSSPTAFATMGIN